ncbi:hypothetical protein VPNG_09771 [Cytospora leucostoma]|uniref:Uncharacterized protein n=1 Tax=Cytospora leucostoma TaxID=1230097 RepID=A0A423VLP1_9PEZI|nr:hypothetical protein VPNG_09771 [Cytospora leucostoma]
MTHGYIQGAKQSRLGKFGRGIRRWRVKRTKPRSEAQRMPHAPSPKDFTLSEETIAVDDVPSQSYKNETPEEISLQDVVLEETSIEKDIEMSVSIIQEELRPTPTSSESVTPQEIAVQETSTRAVASGDLAPYDAVPNMTCRQDAQEGTSSVEKECIREPTNTISRSLPTGYSSLNWAEVIPPVEVVEDKVVVFKQNMGHARTFAKSLLNDKLEDKQWNVQSAHVAGLAGIDRLETLAILLALQWARQVRETELKLIQDGSDERPVFRVCSDSMAALLWLKKAISLGIAVRKAAQKMTGDTDDLAGLLTLSTVLDKCEPVRFSDYSCPESNFTSAIGRRTLEEYYKLCKLGSVEFHWVPAHRGLTGNEIADKEAGIACQWYANAAPQVGQGVGIFLPLKIREFRGGWKREPQPTDGIALQTLEDGHVNCSEKTYQGMQAFTIQHNPQGRDYGRERPLCLNHGTTVYTKLSRLHGGTEDCEAAAKAMHALWKADSSLAGVLRKISGDEAGPPRAI